ncbi:MAG: hypothetical protein QOF51_2159, partial [Chloroflexota bacterium]|nr:hypothetical protein [Chloroflexota bacterium]
MWFDLIRWLVALELAGLAALPLAYRLFPALPGIAPGIAKALALILIGYVAWITGMIGATAFTGPTIVVICAILAAASWLPWGRVAQRAWRANRATAIGAEVAFLLVFAVATWVRAHNAAIAGTEKPMDMTFLTSLIEANRLPAQDLWLAQFGLPYYYLGYLIYALPAKAVGLQPAVAYNLAVVTVIALSATAAFGLAAALVQRAGAGQRLALGLGAVGAFALAVMGDLEAFFEWLAGSNVGDAGFWAAMGIKNVTASAAGFPPADGGWWFKAARVIPNLQPDGITEFPNFSFLLGDLHPHYMA